MNKLDITSKEISSLENMDELFEDYCKKSGITLDFSKSENYNAYACELTGTAFIWFMRAIFFVINYNKEDYGEV